MTTTTVDLDEIVKIRPPESKQTTDNFLDVRVELEVSDRAFGIKVDSTEMDVRVFMPIGYEAGTLGDDHANSQVVSNYFKDWQKWDTLPAQPFPWTDIRDIVVAGNSYLSLEANLTPASRAGLIPLDGEPVPLAKNSELPVSAAKLLLTMLAQAADEAETERTRDRIALVTDKLLLYCILPVIMSEDALRAIGVHSTTSSFYRAAAEYLRSPVLGLDLSAPMNGTFLNGTVMFLSAGKWGRVFYPRKDDPNYKGPVYGTKLSVPVDFLNDEIRSQLESVWALIEGPVSSLWQELLGSLADDWTGPSDYHLLFGVVDAFVLAERDRVNAFKLYFRRSTPILPFVDEIDVRPALWQEEAASLSIDVFTISRQASAIAELLSTQDAKTDLGYREHLNEQLRRVSRARFELRKRAEVLRDEVAEAGFQLIEEDASDPFPHRTYRLVRRFEVSTVTQVERKAVVEEPLTRSIRAGLLRKRVTLRSTRRHTRRWFESVVVKRTVTEDMPTEWRPLDAYLDRTIPAEAMTARRSDGSVDQEATDSLRAEIRRALVPLGQNTGSIEALRNRDKEIVEFAFENGVLVDRRGRSIEAVLETMSLLIERVRSILLVPVQERRGDGTLKTIKYLAVHNPLASRGSDISPEIYAVETYRHRLIQEVHHFLGPLSHTVTLFPGEKRRMRILAESRFVTSQKQESRTSQRSSIESKSSLQTQLRSEIERESSATRKSNWSVSASGGANLGIVKFGGKAGGGGESSKSTRDFAKRINDKVMSVSSGVSEVNEVQFASISETTSSEQLTSEQTVEFENPNAGRAVTHKFFQVMNKFSSSLQIVDVKIVVEYQEPWFPGSWFTRTDVFKLSELGEILPEIETSEREKLINEIALRLRDRYAPTSTSMIWYQEIQFPIEPSPDYSPPDAWYVNSGQFFVDTEVANFPATEPYAELARNAEVALQLARVERIKAEAKAIGEGKYVLPTTANTTAVDIDLT